MIKHLTPRPNQEVQKNLPEIIKIIIKGQGRGLACLKNIDFSFNGNWQKCERWQKNIQGCTRCKYSISEK